VSWADIASGSSEVLGTAAILLGTAGLAAVAIVVRTHLRALSPVQIALPMGLAGLPLIALATVVVGTTHPASLQADPGNVKALAAMLLLGLMNAGFGPLLYYGLILRWGATRTALIGYVVPVIGVGLSVLALHDRLSVELAIGLALVTASFLWVRPSVAPPAAPVTARLRTGLPPSSKRKERS
jgi:drug/metabolite transporter (DMT)-like permease